MVRGRIGRKTKDRFRRAIRDVVNGLSRRIQVYKQSLKHDCPNCYYDKLTNSSTGKCKWTALEARDKQTEYETSTGKTNLMYKFFKVGRCPICRGKGFLETPRKVWISALVTWNPGNRNNTAVDTPAGFEGATLIELKTDPKYYKLFRNCEKVIIDKNVCKLAKPPVLRGLGNEAVLVITVFTTDLTNIEKDEILKKYD